MRRDSLDELAGAGDLVLLDDSRHGGKLLLCPVNE